jgi:ribosomal protein S18 acetylase RimI-like enzyme
MSEISIKKVNATDVLALQKISRQTFYDTFAEQNTEEDMREYLEVNLSEEKLSTELNNPNSFFYFAIIEEIPVAYLKVNTGNAQSDLKNPNGFEIERIYVEKAFHGKKVADALFQKALSLAVELNYAEIWLGVWEENKKAIRFYEKNGFVPFDTHIFTLGTDEQTDILMKKIIA